MAFKFLDFKKAENLNVESLSAREKILVQFYTPSKRPQL